LNPEWEPLEDLTVFRVTISARSVPPGSRGGD
jgi:hypothetical protein